MQNISKFISNELVVKIIKIMIIIIAIPFLTYIINLVILTIFNLGYGTGNFIRNLYNLVC